MKNNNLPNHMVIGPIRVQGDIVFLTFRAQNPEGVSLMYDPETEDIFLGLIKQHYRCGDLSALNAAIENSLHAIKADLKGRYGTLYDFVFEGATTKPPHLLEAIDQKTSVIIVKGEAAHSHAEDAGANHEMHTHDLGVLVKLKNTFDKNVAPNITSELDGEVKSKLKALLQTEFSSKTIESIGQLSHQMIAPILPDGVEIADIALVVPYDRDDPFHHPGIPTVFHTPHVASDLAI